ncbi:MAG: peptidylprolyl isomerase [Trueperaceae bacterium]
MNEFVDRSNRRSNRLNRRAVRWLGVITLLLLLTLPIAAWAQPDDGEPAENPVVLRAGEYEETLTDFDARFEIAIRGLAASQGLELTDDVRAQLESFKPSYLEQRATEVALVQEAERRDIEVSEETVDERVAEVQSSLVEGQDFSDLLAQAGFRDEAQLRGLVRETEQIQRALDAVEAEIEVSESEIQEFYDANQEMFQQPEQVCARHILVESVDEAEQVLGDLEEGADFATLASERSIDPGGQGGGDLGCFARGRMVPPFEEAAFAATTGEPVGPVESQFGQHVILVYERNEPSAADLEEVSAAIEQQLQTQEVAATIEELREDAGIELFPERLGVPVQSPPNGEPAGETPTGEQPDKATEQSTPDDGEGDEGEGGEE